MMAKEMWKDSFEPEDDASLSPSDESEDSESETDEEENISNIDDDDDDDERLTQEEQNDLDASNTLTFICGTLCDFSGEEPGDLPFKKDEMLTVVAMRQDGWWEAENEAKQRGLVPSTFLKVPEQVKNYLEGTPSVTHYRIKEQMWKKLRTAVKQSSTTNEVLCAFGALPYGFYQSSLSKLLSEDSRYSTKSFLIPKFSDSGLAFKDLYCSSHGYSLMPISTCVQRIITLVAFRQIHFPGIGFDITSRHVRICLHDGSKVLSNIHTVRCRWDPKIPKTWTFIPKVSINGSCLEEGQCFVRSHTSSATVGILFQPCMTYIKLATGERGELSCGWVFMRLFDDSGLPVPSRTKILHVHDGIPFLNQQDPLHHSEKGGPLKNFILRSKYPRLVVRISTPRRTINQQLDLLPATLIGPVSTIHVLVIYRKVLAEKIYRERSTLDGTDLIHSPFLATFPYAFCQPDILDVLRNAWSEKMKAEKSNLKKDEKKLKLSFQQLYLETVFIVLQCCSIPPFILGNLEVEQERKTKVAQMIKQIQEQGHVATACAPGLNFCALSVKNFTLDSVGQYYKTIDEL